MKEKYKALIEKLKANGERLQEIPREIKSCLGTPKQNELMQETADIAVDTKNILFHLDRAIQAGLKVHEEFSFEEQAIIFLCSGIMTHGVLPFPVLLRNEPSVN